jgi:rhamnose transport system ATP-binding protein
MPAPLLELCRLTKSFGGARALRGVDFDLRAGEVHALLGENGAGKSTLIRIITGAHRPDSGTVAVDGHPAGPLDPRAAHRLGIACIYQQPALFPDLSIAENLALRLETGGALRRVDWPARHERATALLERVGARLDPRREVRDLSMPEQQLVEIACALGAGARIVIMDEPTAALTQADQTRLHGVVRELRAQGTGVIYITHRLEEIFALADRVTVLRDGESVGTRPAAGLTESELIRLMVGREVAQPYPPAERPPGDAVLRVRGLGRHDTGVRDVSFDLHAGEILGLAGLVGAGRTELARILFGLTPADTGTIELAGRPVRPRSPREAVELGLAYVPEDRRRHGVILDLPLAHNTSLASHRRLFPGGWLRPTAERRLTEDFIRDLGIRGGGPLTPAGSLSGGNQQKVALARWLATGPRVLILDEPTQGVDIGAKVEIHRLVRRLAGEGLAVLLISSDLPEVIGMSDRIGVMRGGTLTAVLPGGATPDTVMAAALGRATEAAR